MATMCALDMVQEVSEIIKKDAPKPTELLRLAPNLSYGEIQDIVSKLLESGTVEFGSDRRLRLVDVHP